LTAWKAAMDAVTGPAFTVGEYLVFLAFAFHAVNGIRLALIELGFAVGPPIEPVYPYATSVGRQRPLALAVMLIAGVLAIWGGYNFFLVD
jgi:succinate dehydrogenase/fumarate reductase cytochrome b subunit